MERNPRGIIANGGRLPVYPQADYFLEVSKGNIEGHTVLTKIGVNPLVGTIFEDVWDAGGLLVYPTAGETWEIVSDSTDDDVGGTGATEVTITYLDDNYVEQSEIKAMDGTTPVTFTATDSFRFNRASVTAVGSGAENAGNITIRVSGAGATRGQINTGNNASLDAHFTVPANKTAYLMFFGANINKNEDIEVHFLSTIGDDGIFALGGLLSVYQGTVINPIVLPGRIIEKTDVNIMAKSTNTNAIAAITSQYILVDN
jgi:hypothetical protein